MHMSRRLKCLIMLVALLHGLAGCNFSATVVRTLEFPADEQHDAAHAKQITFDRKHTRRKNLQHDLEVAMDELDKRDKSYSIKLLCDGPDPNGDYCVIIDCSYLNKDNIVYSARNEIDDKYYVVKRSIDVEPRKGRDNRDEFLADLIEYLDKRDISKK